MARTLGVMLVLAVLAGGLTLFDGWGFDVAAFVCAALAVGFFVRLVADVIRKVARGVAWLTAGTRVALAASADAIASGGFSLLRNPDAPPIEERPSDPLSIRELLASGGLSALRATSRDERIG